MSQMEEGSLKRIAFIALVKAAWSSDIIKKRTDHLPYNNKGWHQRWIENELEYAIEMSQILPPKLRTDFEEVFSHVGEEIKHWKEYLSRSLGLEFPYTEVIYLTSTGKIDESEILEKYWLPNRQTLPAHHDFNYLDLLCMFGREQFIYEWRNELVDHIINKVNVLSKNSQCAKKFEKDIRVELRQLEHKQEVIDFVLCNWITIEYMKKIDNWSFFVVADGKCRTKPDVLKEILSRVSELGLARLYKYFWNESFFHTDNNDICIAAIRKLKETFSYLNYYEKKNRLEIMSMLLSEIPECEKQEIFKQHWKTLLELVYGSWRYQSLFLKIFEASCLDIISNEKCLYVFTFMAEKAMNDSQLKRKWHRSNLERVVMDIESHLDKTYKTSFKWDISAKSPADVYILDIILNLNTPLLTTAIATRTKNFWYDSNSTAKRLELLEKFLGARTPLRELVVESLKNLREDILNEQSCYLDELNALSDFSDKHGLGVGKKDIDGVKYILGDVELPKKLYYGRSVKNFIKWYFDSDLEDERLLEVKKRFQEEELCRRTIFSFFPRSSGDYEIFEFNELQAEEFVDFICYFRGKKIFNLDDLWKDASSVFKFLSFCDGKIADYYRKSSPFPIQHLLRFCGLSEEKIEELKIKCINNIQRLAEYYQPFGWRFISHILLEDFFTWVTEDRELRRKIIEEFMGSPNGMRLLKCTLDGWVTEKDKPFALLFFNEWVKSCKNISEMKKQIMAMDETELELKKDEKIKLSVALDKLERGENLLSSDVEGVFSFMSF